MSKTYKDLLLKEVKELLIKLPPNVRIRVYYDGMSNGKYTLNQIGDALFEFIKTTNTRLDNLTSDVNSLKQDVKGLKQEVKNINVRIDQIDARLDYNSLQIERIQKRLDYNGLKRLPESK